MRQNSWEICTLVSCELIYGDTNGVTKEKPRHAVGSRWSRQTNSKSIKRGIGKAEVSPEQEFRRRKVSERLKDFFYLKQKSSGRVAPEIIGNDIH